MIPQLLIAVAVAGFLLVATLFAFLFRRVVEPNEVHIVQSSKGTVAYGASDATEDEGNLNTSKNGNAYFEWPSFLPFIGVQVKVLPLSVFQLDLLDYEAYDVGKVPFLVDVVGFFRINDAAVAAKRISTFGPAGKVDRHNHGDGSSLKEQLTAILQGAVRTILAQHDIEQIMLDRSTFGEMFTNETRDQLKAWGVMNVKNIELMDIRDPDGEGSSKTVTNIMAKKQSFIDKESREEVATNEKLARIAEIDAQREVDVQAQEAEELVGRRTAEKDKAVGIANEQAHQEIKAQARETKVREMAILEVDTVRKAEITKAQQIVAAQQDRETVAVRAEGEKQQTVIVAEGVLERQRKEAEGTLAIGTASAEAKRLAEMATVSPQLALAAEIGENSAYQTYLISIRNVEMNEAVGIEQAKALQKAGIKIIANTGTSVDNGLTSVGDLFSSKGGTALASAVEAFAQTPHGASVLETFGVETEDFESSSSNGAAS